MPGLHLRKAAALLSLLLLANGCGADQIGLSVPSAPAGTWQRQDTLLSGNANEEYSLQEPTVLREGSSVIFGGSAAVFKLWHTCGWGNSNVCYAESPDGVSFTRYNSGKPILSGTGRSFVFRSGKLLYMYTTTQAFGRGWDRYESQDGIHWTLTAARTLALGDAAWEQQAGNIFVWIESGTWYAVYEAMGKDIHWRMGLATSPDGITWSKNTANPFNLILPSCGGPEIHKMGSLYYMWAQCAVAGVNPTDIYRFHSTDLLHWTPELIELHRETPDEGRGTNLDGQVADPSMVEVDGAVYMYYDATPTQEPTAAGAIHLKVVVAHTGFAGLTATK